MSFLGIIGIILVILGILVLVGVVGGGLILGIIALLVGAALLLSGSGRLNL